MSNFTCRERTERNLCPQPQIISKVHLLHSRYERTRRIHLLFLPDEPVTSRALMSHPLRGTKQRREPALPPPQQVSQICRASRLACTSVCGAPPPQVGHAILSNFHFGQFFFVSSPPPPNQHLMFYAILSTFQILVTSPCLEKPNCGCSNTRHNAPKHSGFCLLMDLCGQGKRHVHDSNRQFCDWNQTNVLC